MGRLSPVIGITTSRQKNDGNVSTLKNPEAYSIAISKAGGLPFLIPLGLSVKQLEQVLSIIDGVLLSGGGDVDPKAYGIINDDRSTSIDPDRDREEFVLVERAIELKKPFLGICRGLQVINVVLGGTLYTNLPGQYSKKINHRQAASEQLGLTSHKVRIVQGSRLEDILGTRKLFVNSRHHQGIKRLADKLIASAYAPDNLIEAIEIPDHPFGIAVQWHPENLIAHEPMLEIFRAFVNAAANAQRHSV
jgi:putative glutamine amidotransferase